MNTETEIQYIKNFITELSFIQSEYFKGACCSAKINGYDAGENLLFDFIFNEKKEETFCEYLKGYNLTLENLQEEAREDFYRSKVE